MRHRDPEVVFGHVFLLEAWGTEANKPTRIEEHRLFVGLAAFGGKAKQLRMFLKMCGFLASVPQASKKPLGQKTTSGSL